MKTCKMCGAPLPLPSGRGRPRTKCESCSPSVRKQRPATVVPGGVTPGGVLAATRSDLAAAGVEFTHLGQAALHLAAAIDSGDEHGAGLAALVKQWRDTMRVALPSDQADTDPIQALRDELAARRDSNAG